MRLCQWFFGNMSLMNNHLGSLLPYNSQEFDGCKYPGNRDAQVQAATRLCGTLKADTGQPLSEECPSGHHGRADPFGGE
jgi:hypothetical protein